MASAHLNEMLNCSRCLDIFPNLITLKCGHNFCQDCLIHVLDTKEFSGVEICPACGFKYLELEKKSDTSDPHPEESGDSQIFCTYCIHSRVPAVQSCLHCESSLCDSHLKAHTKSSEHILTRPTSNFKDRKCPIHKKILDFYCLQDKMCICILCGLEEHRDHSVLTFNDAYQKVKDKLKNALDILTFEEEALEKTIRSVLDCEMNLQRKVTDVEDRVNTLITDVRRHLDELEKRTMDQISNQKKQVSQVISEKLRDLNKKKTELSGKICDTEGLQRAPDPLLLSQWLNSGGSELYKLKRTFSEYRRRDVKTSSSHFDEEPVFETLHRGLFDLVTGIRKGIYIHEASDLILDVNTAANNVKISNDLKELSCPGSEQWRIDKEERFDYSQVLSTKTFSSGRLYWDFELGEFGSMRVGVAYPSIERKHGQSRIGENAKSWCVGRENNIFYFIHDAQKWQLQHLLSCKKIRIYLDYEAGQLSFYDLDDSARHLYTFTADFTEPLHAAFCVFFKSWVRILS